MCVQLQFLEFSSSPQHMINMDGPEQVSFPDQVCHKTHTPYDRSGSPFLSSSPEIVYSDSIILLKLVQFQSLSIMIQFLFCLLVLVWDRSGLNRLKRVRISRFKNSSAGE